MNLDKYLILMECKPVYYILSWVITG